MSDIAAVAVYCLFTWLVIRYTGGFPNGKGGTNGR